MPEEIVPTSQVSLASALTEGALPSTPVDFGAPPPEDPCSWNECTRGHKFPPIMQMARCPGCGGPIVAVKMVNCPICNEPVQSMTFRMEHLPQPGQIGPLCKGAPTLNEAIQLKVLRQHAKQEEANHIEREMISKI